MGNHFCSKCKTSQKSTPLILFDCSHHTCIHCVKNDENFQYQFKLIECFNCKKKSLVDQQGGCKTIVWEQEWRKCKKQKFEQNSNNNQKQYYKWLRQRKIKSLQKNLALFQFCKNNSIKQFEEFVICNKLDQKNQALKRYDLAVLEVNRIKSYKLIFETQYTIDGKKQNSNQFCKICLKNKDQSSVHTCGHVCLCQKYSQLTFYPIFQSKGEIIKSNLPVNI